MSKPFRFASAVSLLALAPMIASCASSNSSTVTATGFGGQANGEVGLATRALAALDARNYDAAVSLAERAVEKNPADAGFRGLLGKAYFAAGRFASAEAAFKDSLAIYPTQPQVVLKLALAQIAQGKHAEAASFLEAARTQMDPADFGLALALAGRPAEAIPVLETAARIPNANARVRQNLALALALSGDWTNARVVASQDVPADQLDARLQQWMQLAKPARASDQVAALTGVTPAAADPGQPVRLALRKPETQVAQAAIAQPEPASVPEVQVAEAAAPPPAEPYYAPPPPPPPSPPPPPPPAVAEAPEPAPEFVAASSPEAVYSAPAARPVRAKPVRAKVPAQRPPVRKASLQLRRGQSNYVVQLGSYRSPQHVGAGWERLTQRYPALREYLPVRARFDSANGTFWRLSIQGFASQREAIERCQRLKARGGSCFVRNIAGDAPVRFAGR